MYVSKNFVQRVYSLEAHNHHFDVFVFLFSFCVKVHSANKFLQTETQNIKERHIAVGASKPNLVDFYILKVSQTL